MDKRTRVGQLYEIGVEASGGDYSTLIAGVAAMIADSEKRRTKTPEKKKRKNSLPFKPQLFLDSMLSAAGDRIVKEPFDKRWVYKLETTLRNLDGVTLADAKSVGDFIKNKGWWKDRAPGVDKVIHYLPQLIADARGDSTGGDSPEWG